LHAVDRFLIARHDLHGDLQKAHHRAVFEIDHQRRIDGVVDGGFGRGFLGMSGSGDGHDRRDHAVLAHFQIGHRMQLRVDRAAGYDGDEGEHEDADPLHQRVHESPGILFRNRKSFVGCVGHVNDS
jgi:hypothetical protein